jgi:hypothetical protein
MEKDVGTDQATIDGDRGQRCLVERNFVRENR